MAARFAAVVPRMVVLGLIWLLATATLTYAAGEKLTTPAKAPTPVATTPRPSLIVPDIRGQAFVFAKGILEDAGFSWRVTGTVKGYATNVVASQQPAAGTRVEDTGAPTLKLTLRRGTYGQNGLPENAAPYAGTSIVLPKRAALAKTAAPTKTPVKTMAKKPVRHKAAKRARASVKARPKLVPHRHMAARARRPAFNVPGAPKEPLDEIPLAQRADRLGAWIDSRPQRTNRNVQHWLYQHAWIVTGARFGWSHGDQALVRLIAVDRQVERIWGIGYRSEAVARAVLAEVRRREK